MRPFLKIGVFAAYAVGYGSQVPWWPTPLKFQTLLNRSHLWYWATALLNVYVAMHCNGAQQKLFTAMGPWQNHWPFYRAENLTMAMVWSHLLFNLSGIFSLTMSPSLSPQHHSNPGLALCAWNQIGALNDLSKGKTNCSGANNSRTFKKKLNWWAGYVEHIDHCGWGGCL